MAKVWDNATLKKLKALADKGLSTAEIGKKLGFSKNAVVGKLNRMGWNPKASGVVPAKKATAKTPAKAPAKKAAVTAKTPAKKTAVAKTPAKKATVAKAPAKKALAAPKKAVAAKKPVAEPKKPVAKAAAPAKASGKSSPKNLAMHQRIIQHSLEMANLKPNQCRWPIGDPDTEGFHFCGAPVFVGKPYCYEHCKNAYQFNPPKKK